MISFFLGVYRRLRAILADPVRDFQIAMLMLVLLVAVGTLGYILLEQMPIIDAFYMTIITVSTVGFGEIHPLSNRGRVFTSVLIILGLTIVTTAVSSAASVVLGPQLWLSIQERKMEETLRTVEKHYVVCGYGRMGRQIIRDLRARKASFVVIEMNEDIREELLEENIPYIIGDGTQDDILLDAGIERAVGLVSALNSDADNVMTVLSAREINPKIFIVARASTNTAESKLRRAGADRVVSPYQIGGHRLALALLRPAVHDFLNLIFNVSDDVDDMEVGQIYIQGESSLAGMTIAHANLRQSHHVSILAIQKINGEFTMNPHTQHVIQTGETLIVIGPPEAIYRIEEKWNPEGPDADDAAS